LPVNNKEINKQNSKKIKIFNMWILKISFVNNEELRSKTSGTTWLSRIQVFKEMQKFETH